MGCLIMQDGRNPQSRIISEMLLYGCIKTCILINGQVMQRPEFANTIRAIPGKEILIENLTLLTQFLLTRIPPTCDLRDFFLQSHPLQQVRNPIINRQTCVLIRKFFPSISGNKRLRKANVLKWLIVSVDEHGIRHLLQPSLRQHWRSFQSGLAPSIPHFL